MRRRLVAFFLIFLGAALLTETLLFPILRLFLENPETAIISPQPSAAFLPSLPKPTTGQSLPSDLWESTESAKPSEFFLTIEKLGIRKARVFVDVDVSEPKFYQDKLQRGLGHVAGTPYPGQWGSSYIIGHSALPFFYDPQKYEMIFSRLDALAVGDEILIEVASEKVVYRVSDLKVVADWKRPENILSGGGYKLILMTCYPPGFTLRRLLVIAELTTNN